MTWTEIVICIIGLFSAGLFGALHYKRERDKLEKFEAEARETHQQLIRQMNEISVRIQFYVFLNKLRIR